MSNPYIPATAEQVEEMLDVIGAKSIDEIFSDQVPAKFQAVAEMGLPPAMSEMEIVREITRLAALNQTSSDHVSFLGGGIYDHFVPSAIMHVANRQEYVTGYTPYQPEASQGLLQAFFEYQSLISRLFDMPVSNASLYDGASALGEALFLALGVRPDRDEILLPMSLNPEYTQVAHTYLAHAGTKLITVPCDEKTGRIDVAQVRELLSERAAALVVQHPNYFGCLEEMTALSEAAHEAGALLIAVVDPVSLGVLAPPGSYGADIAIAEGQGLGLNQYAGGETLGIFTCANEFMRKVPGRLVGVARDRENRRGFVLTLQTREQHIRRAKATSNICTNHAHNALRATIHMCLLGPYGIERVAKMCVRNTQRLREKIRAAKPEALMHSAPVFKEFAVRVNRPGFEVRDALVQKGFFAGIPCAAGGKHILVAVTEKRTDQEIDAFFDALREYL